MNYVGEYSVVRELGRGGMGIVYEGQERLSGRPVALKVMHDRVAGSSRGRELFLSEMSILGTLDHPNVVRLLAGFEEQGQLVMVLELIRGQTLRQVIRQRGRLLWQDAVFIARQMLHGLVAAHERAPPVVHRDLKPVNVMMTYEGVAKVMDFGIAKVVQGETHATTDVGTLRYMSPEQIDGGLIDTRSDLYAVGLLLYEMLSGAAPFQSESTRELLTLQCTAPVPPLAAELGTPGGLVSIIETLLAKRAQERPASARVALAMLESLGPVASLSFSLGHAGPAVVPASPGSNFPGASGWSTASSWGGQASSGWQPTGATNGPASAQPVTGGVAAPGHAMPGASQWRPSMPGGAAVPSSAMVPRANGHQDEVRVGRESPPSRRRVWPWGLALAGLVTAGGAFALANTGPDSAAAAPDPPEIRTRQDSGEVPPVLASPREGDSISASKPPRRSEPEVAEAVEAPLPTDPAKAAAAACPRFSARRVTSIFGSLDVDDDSVPDVLVRIDTGTEHARAAAISGTSLKPLWKTKDTALSGGHWRPVVGSGVFIQTFENTIVAHDAKTGAVLWSRDFENRVNSVGIIDGTAHLPNADGSYLALDARTGAEKTPPTLPSSIVVEYNAFLAFDESALRERVPHVENFSYGAAVLAGFPCARWVSDGCWETSGLVAFVGTGASKRAMVAQVTNGAIEWSREFDELSFRPPRAPYIDEIHSGPIIAASSDLVLFGKSTSKSVELHMMEVESGDVLWDLKWEGTGSKSNARVLGDRAYVLTGCLLALDARTGDVEGSFD